MNPPVIETGRLMLRPLVLADKDPLLEFFTDPEAIAFLPTEVSGEKFAELWIQRQLRRYESTGYGLSAVVLKETGELLGQCGLIRQFVDGIPKWEVGYHLIRRHWGKGYATEAACAWRDHCFENEMAETLISLIDAGNLRSQAVAARNGMSFWKETIFKGLPVHVHRIRRAEWEQLPR